MAKFKLKHPDGKFVYQGEDGEYFLQNGEESAAAMTLPEFRKNSKYDKSSTTYKRGNLKYISGDVKEFVWNGGTKLIVINLDESESTVQPERKEYEQSGEDTRTLEDKVLDWAFKGLEFKHEETCESSGELLYIEAKDEGENPFLVARRIESKRLIQFRAYEPTEMATHIKQTIRDGFVGTDWKGVLL